MWSSAGVLDQGATPHCVGFTGYNWLRAGPVTNRKLPFTPADLYNWAQMQDEWPGTNYDGTSALGLMKALKERGYVTEYRWALDIETIFAWLITSGPLLMGSWWYMDMSIVDKMGFIQPTGEQQGGHEYLLIGADRDKSCPDGTKGAIRMINSWGTGWGQQGRAWISRAHLESLLRNEGDCCSATEVKIS
jgi:hypothetical protein